MTSPATPTHLADEDGVLVVDETGLLKKGTQSAGVARQYSGTAGRIENCQVGVFLAFAGRHGHTLVHRELYLPREWAADADRRAEADIPDRVTFATKPQLAQRMLQRAWAAGVEAAWATADTVYGNDGTFRRFLEASEQPDVLAVQSNQQLWDGPVRSRVDAIAATWPAGAWQRAGAGAGVKGPRWSDWAVRAFGPLDERGWQLWLLVRRHREKANERAYDLGRGPADPPGGSWSGWPGRGGPSMRGSSGPRGGAGWTRTRSATGAGGIAPSPSACSPWPCCVWFGTGPGGSVGGRRGGRG
jgi:SRSO17 transposase